MVIVEIPFARIHELWGRVPTSPAYDVYLLWELTTGKELEWEHSGHEYRFWVVCVDELEAVEYKLKWL